MLKTSLSYHGGTVIIKGLAHIPFATVDPRTNLLRAPALHYSNIICYLEESGIDYNDSVMDLIPSPLFVTGYVSLREYQKKALEKWVKAGMKGCIVLPTGSGKTIIGIKAIERVNSATLIVVPTLDLMGQWTEILSKHFANAKIGNLGGGTDDIQAITVATYDSAYLRAASIGNKFSLIVFDEVHHLSSTGI